MTKKSRAPRKPVSDNNRTKPTSHQHHSGADSVASTPLSRRTFLGGVSGVTATTIATGILGSQPLLPTPTSRVQARALRQLTPEQRRERAFQIRLDAAQLAKDIPIPNHPTNGDESLYVNKIATYSKGLPHNSRGEVDPSAYAALISALSSGRTEDLEAVPMGSPDPARQRKLVNPQAGVAFDLQGTDSHQLAIPPAPAFASAEQAAEAVELYWQALLRDVPFVEYATHPLANAAAFDLTRLTDFRGPKEGRAVTPRTLFRGFTPGDLKGPYLSQFLLRGTPFGAEYVERRMRTVLPGIDYLTRYNEWLAVQNGVTPEKTDRFDSVRRYVNTGRDLAQWVHVDVLFQAYFDAALILLTPPDPSDLVTGGGLGAPLNPGNPYNDSETMTGFGTFGGPHIATLLCEVATRALKAQWYQKWFVHRRIRPEVFGGRVHNYATGAARDYPIHSEVLNSRALTEVVSRYGTYLLPQAYPEGSPLHPSYGAGHATVAGACVTILKALFDESFVVPNPVVPTVTGTGLTLYTGPDANQLTVGGELNKLAANVALGRNFAGIHWRTDYTASLRLGESVAISILREQRLCYKEDFDGFTFTTFDGQRVTV